VQEDVHRDLASEVCIEWTVSPERNFSSLEKLLVYPDNVIVESARSLMEPSWQIDQLTYYPGFIYYCPKDSCLSALWSSYLIAILFPGLHAAQDLWCSDFHYYISRTVSRKVDLPALNGVQLEITIAAMTSGWSDEFRGPSGVRCAQRICSLYAESPN
jgi:hypothetical protein